ncbi:MAG: hypothetical protein ALAOOOJD_01461 [bacterium]|nr:hypothetical protein [bacterium]
MIFIDRGNNITAHTRGIFRIMFVHLEFVAVIFVQPILRADPQKTFVVLKNTINGVLGKPLFQGNALKIEIVFLRVKGSRPI